MADNLREGVWSCNFRAIPLGNDAGQLGLRVGFRQPGRDDTGRCPVLRSSIRRRRHLPGREGGFNLAQPPEVRQHLRREIDERGNGPIAYVLPCPAQDLPHLPVGDGEWRVVSGEWKFTTRYSLLATRF